MDDPETLDLAASAMGEVRLKSALPYLKALNNRKEVVRIYINSHFSEKQKGSWAKVAIATIGRHVAFED